jgi:hypothetical protein
LIYLQCNHGDSHITGMISVYPEWSPKDCFHALAGGPLAITIMSFRSVLNSKETCEPWTCDLR